jgi:hypothetical protein
MRKLNFQLFTVLYKPIYRDLGRGYTFLNYDKISNYVILHKYIMLLGGVYHVLDLSIIP